MKQNLADLKEEIQFYNNSSIHQDFNTPLTIMNTITTQKISKEIDLTQ